MLLTTSAGPAAADFKPIPLTRDSYNQDTIVERTAPAPALSVTSASMEQGLANSGFTWFERGYLPDWPSAGLPEAGSVLTSDQSPDYRYQMPASYQTNNALLIDANRSDALIGLAHPTNCAVLSFLTSSGGARNVIRYTINFQDGSSESDTFTSPNWYDDGNPAWSANGKVNVTTFIHADLTSYDPRLYSVDVSLADPRTPIKSIGLALASGTGHTAVFAVSGAQAAGGVFEPLTISGYTVDLVVEASAIKPGFLETNTTATIERGTSNAGFTWYERGYDAAAPESGVPPAGTTILVDSASAHQFTMATNYSEANSVLIESDGTEAVLVPTTPVSCSALSFLTAASGGAVTNQCVVRYAGGATETNSFVSPDWLGSSPAALTLGGRVSVSNRLVDDQGASVPKLYAVDVPLHHTNAVTRVSLSRTDGNHASRAFVLALAGQTAGGGASSGAVLSVAPAAGGQFRFHSTKPGRLQSCTVLGRAATWRDEGAIQQDLSLQPRLGEAVRLYRVLAQ